MLDRHDRQRHLAYWLDHPKKEQWGVAPDDIIFPENVTWDDFFTPLHADQKAHTECLFQQKDFWTRLTEIFPHVSEPVEAFTEALVRASSREEATNPFEFLADNMLASSLLKPEFWAGNLHNFNRVWYRLRCDARRGASSLSEVREEIAAQSGTVSVLDAMQAAVVDADEMFRLIAEGRLREVIEEFECQGLPLTDDLIFGPKNDFGEPVFQTNESLDKLHKALDILDEYGVVVDPAKIWHGYRNQGSLADYILKERKAYLLEHPVLWKEDHTQISAFDTWVADPNNRHVSLNLVGDNERGRTVSFQKIADNLVMHHVNQDLILSDVTKTFLMTEINRPIDVYVGRVKPIACPKILQNFDDVHEILRKKKQGFNLEDFRVSIDDDETTLLLHASKLGFFTKIAENAIAQKENFTADDILKRNKQSLNVLGEVRQKNELTQLFAPYLWDRSVEDLKRVFEGMNEVDQESYKYHMIEAKISVLRMRSVRGPLGKASALKEEDNQNPELTENKKRRLQVAPSARYRL